MRRSPESRPRTWEWIRNRSGRTTRQGGTQDLEKVSKNGRRGGDGAPQKIRKNDQPQFRLRLDLFLYLLGQLSVRPRLMALCWTHIELNPSLAWSLNQKERLSELRQGADRGTTEGDGRVGSGRACGLRHGRGRRRRRWKTCGCGGRRGRGRRCSHERRCKRGRRQAGQGW